MKVPFGEILLLVLYFCEDAVCYRLDRTRRQQFGTERNKINGNFAGYYALLYVDYILVDPVATKVTRHKEICVAVIVLDHYLVTPANCVNKYKNIFDNDEYYKDEGYHVDSDFTKIYYGDFSQALGAFDRAKFAERLQTIEIEEIIVHENYVYNATHILNDIAYLKVKASFPTDNQLYLCDPDKSFVAEKIDSKKWVLAGAGVLVTHSIYDLHLNSTNVVESSQDLCDSSRYRKVDPGSYVCSKGNTSCHWDYGSPLVLLDGTRPVCLYGIFSHWMKNNSNTPSGTSTSAECMIDGVRFTSGSYYYYWLYLPLFPEWRAEHETNYEIFEPSN